MTIPLTLFKAIAALMTANLESFEKQFGQIVIPNINAVALGEVANQPSKAVPAEAKPKRIILLKSPHCAPRLDLSKASNTLWRHYPKSGDLRHVDKDASES